MIRWINKLYQTWFPEPTADETAAKKLQEARASLLEMQAKVEADIATHTSNLAYLAMYEERVKRLTNRKPDESIFKPGTVTGTATVAEPSAGVVGYE